MICHLCLVNDAVKGAPDCKQCRKNAARRKSVRPAPVRFKPGRLPMPILPTWGGRQSISWRAA